MEGRVGGRVRDRSNRKEMKVKLATSFKIVYNIYQQQINKTMYKTEKYKWTVPFKKKVREKSRECQYSQATTFPDTKGRGNRQEQIEQTYKNN